MALQYLGHAIKTAATWKLLKPHAPALVAAVVLPLMCYDDEDDDLWREDPHEYIRKVSRATSQFGHQGQAPRYFLHAHLPLSTSSAEVLALPHLLIIIRALRYT